MNKEKLLAMFKENLVTWDFQGKKILLQKAIDKYTLLEANQIEEWNGNIKTLSFLVKKNAPFSTIIDLSGITFSSEKQRNVVYTTSIVVNRNYLKNVFDKIYDIKRYTGLFLGTEKIMIIRVIRNRRNGTELYKLDRDTHVYILMQYKDFFSDVMMDKLVTYKNEQWKIFLIVEGIGLPLLKIIFKGLGIVISSGINNLKGSLSPTQFNLSRFMLGVFNTSAYKIITQSFYNNDKFVNKPVIDLTIQEIDLFIKTIIIDEMREFSFIYSSLNKYKKLVSEKNLLLMKKDIENVNKYIKQNPSDFVEVNNKNVTNFNSVARVSKRGIHTYTSTSQSKIFKNLFLKINKVNISTNFRNYAKVDSKNSKVCLDSIKGWKDNSKLSTSCFKSGSKRFYSKEKGYSLVESLVNNHYGINISSILDSNKCIKDKQLEIEKFIFNDIHSTFLTKLKSPDNLIWEGLSVIKNAIGSASVAVNTLKKSKTMLKGKVYSNCFINTHTDIIISIVVSNVIPHALKHSDVTNQHVTGLYKKIGAYLVREYNKSVYIDYKNWCISFLQVSSNKYVDVDFNDPNIKERINTLLQHKPFKIEGLEYSKYISFDQLLKYLHTHSFTEVDYVKYGCDMVELISAHTNLYETVEHYNSYEEKSYRLVTISDESRDEIFDLITYSDNTFPMIYKPANWSVNIEEDGKYNIINRGGYLNTDLDTNFIHNKYKNQGEVKLENLSLIKTINHLQMIEYIINKDVLNIITDRLAKGLLKEILNIDFHSLSNKMSKIKKDGDDILFKQILSYNSTTFVNRQILSNSILLKNSDAIYFPIFVDWRGRLYCITSNFSYQGPDLAKSLLLFKQGVVINNEGVIKLKLYIGRLYGFIKNSSNKSILDWVDVNYKNIIDIDSNFWMKGKEPFRCLAASIELRNYESNKEGFITRLPVYVDGTCNGIQHLSSMASDTNLAEYVNLRKSNDGDVPQDLYRKMAQQAKLDIKNFLKDSEGKHDVIGLINLDRSFIKRCIMTIPYGVTKKGVKNQLILEQFIEVSKNKFKADRKYIDDCFKETIFDLKDIGVIAKIIHNVLFNSYPMLTRLVNYIKKMNKFLFKFNRNLSTFWKTPSGLILEQKYVNPEDIIIRTSIVGIRKSITLHKYKKDGSIVLSKQNKGIIPNIIHSLDAANISILVNKMLEEGININILTIHDAFATNANYVDELTYRIKLAFLVIYADKDFILKFHDNIINNLISQGFIINKQKTHFEQSDEKGDKVKIKIPKPFEAGGFNIKDELLLSNYFMH